MLASYLVVSIEPSLNQKDRGLWMAFVGKYLIEESSVVIPTRTRSIYSYIHVIEWADTNRFDV